MNAGFSNFDTLKKHLLGGSTAKNETRFDTKMKLIGLGMAGAIESFCNRKFSRCVGAQEILPADRVQFLLSRFPIETVSAVEIKQNETDGFILQQTSPIVTIDQEAGIVSFASGSDAGRFTSQVRFTFTGGFWWEKSEPDDVDYPTNLPTGANLLPPDLQLAWLLQCEIVWSKLDKLGLSLTDDPDEQSKISDLKLDGMVKQMIGQHVRYNLT